MFLSKSRFRHECIVICIFVLYSHVSADIHARSCPEASDVCGDYVKNSLNPIVAITFDDGPNNVTTPILLSALRKHNVLACFFLVGCNLQQPGIPELLHSMISEGHLIGSHTYNHADIGRETTNVTGTIERTEEVLKELIGMRPFLFRAPYNSYSLVSSEYLRNVKKYISIGWTRDIGDWTLHSASEVVEAEKRDRALSHINGGGIMTLHEYSWTSEAMDAVLENMKNAGITIAPLWEVMEQESLLSLAKSYGCLVGVAGTSPRPPSIFRKTCNLIVAELNRRKGNDEESFEMWNENNIVKVYQTSTLLLVMAITIVLISGIVVYVSKRCRNMNTVAHGIIAPARGGGSRLLP